MRRTAEKEEPRWRHGGGVRRVGSPKVTACPYVVSKIQTGIPVHIAFEGAEGRVNNVLR
jgi:hypothetical protein